MIEYNDLLRKIENSRTVYETLSAMYEKSRFEEVKESLYMEIIDPAIVPDVPIKPKKKLIVGVSVLFSLIFGIVLAIFLAWCKVNLQINGKAKSGK